MGTIKEKLGIKYGVKDIVVVDSSVVKTVADMQRDLDAYHTAFANITGYMMGKFDGHKPTILAGLAASREVNEDIDCICDIAIRLRTRCDELENKLNCK